MGDGSNPTHAVKNALRAAKPFNRKKYWQAVESHDYHQRQYWDGNRLITG